MSKCKLSCERAHHHVASSGVDLESLDGCTKALRIKRGKKQSELDLTVQPGGTREVRTGDCILVTFPHTDPPGENSLDAVVQDSWASDRDGHEGLRVKLAIPPADNMDFTDKTCRVDNIANRAQFVRCLQALQKVGTHDVNMEETLKNILVKSIYQSTQQESEWCAEAIVDRNPPDFVGGRGRQLNKSQQQAAHAAFRQRLTLIQGPSGREKDLIIVSITRANKHRSLGFVKDRRRMNVALTRAKRGVIVIGDKNMLENDSDGWRKWLHWVEKDREKQHSRRRQS